MDLELSLFASLRERAGKGRVRLEGLPEELDVAGLKREVAQRIPELGELDHVSCVVGTDYVLDEHRLKAGDEVAFLPPVSGGSGGPDSSAADYESGVFELHETRLDEEVCRKRVAHASCGAITVFSGNAREWNRGSQVTWLEYEAFDVMTGPEMKRIFARCIEECRPSEEESGGSPRVLRMLVQHRVGKVPIGEPAVVIAVASPHRDKSFVACRFLIDELKKTLPVWKKEFYADGAHWIGDRS